MSTVLTPPVAGPDHDHDGDRAEKQERIPPLENGDHLTREEFHRRYLAMPPDVKGAELIEGIVFMPSPVRKDHHGKPHGMIMGVLFNYVAATPGTDFADNSTVILDQDNEPQPDAILQIIGGQASETADDYIEGAPEFVAEIAGSSATNDLHKKKAAYLRNGVLEYLVWLTEEKRFLWFTLENEEYAEIEPDEDGIYRSLIFPGLWLDSRAALNFDSKAVLDQLNKGLASNEHAEFVEGLAGTGEE